MDDIKFVNAMVRMYPVFRELPELEDLSLFSPGARHVVPAILDANRGDKNTARFAIRLCRAITLYEEGQHSKKKPLYAGLLYGESGAPLREIITAVGESFIGKPADGRQPITVIDCAEFPPGTHPAALFQLTGPKNEEDPSIPPLWPEAYEGADLWSRAGIEILAIERFLERFEKWTEAIVKQMDAAFANHPRAPEVAQFINEIFKGLYEQTKNVLDETRLKVEPLRSVIVFDGIENASPELLARIRSIIQGGGLTILRNGPEQANFTNSIVLLTTYDSMYVSGTRVKIGLSPSSNGALRYSEVRKLLLNDPRFRDIVRDLGDQTLIIRARSFDGQKHRLNVALKQIDQAHKKLNVRIVFKISFKSWLLNRTKEQDQKPEFPDYKVEDVLDRYVRLPLAQKIARGQLRRYDAVIFSAQRDAESPELDIISDPTKTDAAVLTRDDVLGTSRENLLDIAETPATQELYVRMLEAEAAIENYVNSVLSGAEDPTAKPVTSPPTPEGFGRAGETPQVSEAAKVLVQSLWNRRPIKFPSVPRIPRKTKDKS